MKRYEVEVVELQRVLRVYEVEADDVKEAIFKATDGQSIEGSERTIKVLDIERRWADGIREINVTD